MKKGARAFLIIITVLCALGLISFLMVRPMVAEAGTGRVEIASVSLSDGEGNGCRDTYDITRLIVRAERDGRGTTEEVMSLPHDLGELQTGRWNIMVDAYDSRGNFLSTCSTEITVSEDDMLDLSLAMQLPEPSVDVPNGRNLRVEPNAPFTLNANYRPLRVGEDYDYVWTFWPVDSPSTSTHLIDMHGDSSLPSDAFWEIWDWYGGSANDFRYTLDVTSDTGSASFSGRIAVV